jgi:hypothetical protein
MRDITRGGALLLFLIVALLLSFSRAAFVASPWRNAHIAIYAAFVGVVGESAIIDSDHWRHYFLLLGAVWGLAGASYRYRRAAVARAAPLPLARAGAAA